MCNETLTNERTTQERTIVETMTLLVVSIIRRILKSEFSKRSDSIFSPLDFFLSSVYKIGSTSFSKS